MQVVRYYANKEKTIVLQEVFGGHCRNGFLILSMGSAHKLRKETGSNGEVHIEGPISTKVGYTGCVLLK